MGTTAQKLDNIISSKFDLSAAILEKGGGVLGDTADYDAELEYLDSIPTGTGTMTLGNGGNLFDIGVVPNPNISFELKAAALSTDQINAYNVPNARAATESRWGVDQTIDGTRLYFGAVVNITGWSTTRAFDGSANAAYKSKVTNIYGYNASEKRVWFKNMDNGAEINNNGTITQPTDENIIPLTFTFKIFGRPINIGTVTDSTQTYGGASRFYYAKFWENGDLIRDIVPVRKNGVGYLYDKVSRTLYSNLGTGVLKFGADAINVPLTMPQKLINYGDAVRNIDTYGGWDDYDWTDERATWCVFINLDGEIERVYTKDEVDLSSFTLPPVPPHPLIDDPQLSSALTNGGWNWTLNEIKNAAHPMCVGPLYDTIDFKTWMVVDVPTDNYELHLYPQQNTTLIRVDWGDGSEVFAPAATNFGTITHTYATAGRYIIKEWRNDGSYDWQMGYGNTTVTGSYDSEWMFRDQALFKYIFKMNTSAFGLNTVAMMKNLVYLTHGNNPAGRSANTSFGRLTALKGIAFPRGMGYLNQGGNWDQWNPTYKIQAISMPASANNSGGSPPRGTSVRIFRQQIFRPLSDGRADMPQSYFTAAPNLRYFNVPGAYMLNKNYLFQNDYRLEKIRWEDELSAETNYVVGQQTFSGCRSLSALENCCLSGVHTIGADAFRYCNNLWMNEDISFPALSSLGSAAFGEVPLRRIDLGSTGNTPNITVANSAQFSECRNLKVCAIHGQPSQIPANMFNGCYSLETIDLSECASVPTLANVNAFNNCKVLQQIIVPDALYDTWKAASVWSTSAYNNKIVKASEATPYS